MLWSKLMKKMLAIALSLSLLFNYVSVDADASSNVETIDNQNIDSQTKVIDPTENFFPIESWQKYYKILTPDEKKEIKELCENFNNLFIQICSDSSKLAEPYQGILEKYRKFKNIEKCDMQICYNLVKEEDAKNLLACKEPGELTTDFCKSISSEEEASLKDFLLKLKDFWKKSICQIQPLLENKTIAKAKLSEYFNQNNISLILSIDCDHPISISECVRLLN